MLSLASLRDAGSFDTESGGIASLNHRLMAVNPPGWIANAQLQKVLTRASAPDRNEFRVL